MITFLIITLIVWIIQVLFIFSDMMLTVMEGPDNGYIKNKKELLFILIPYSWVVPIIKGIIKWFKNLK